MRSISPSLQREIGGRRRSVPNTLMLAARVPYWGRVVRPLELPGGSRRAGAACLKRQGHRILDHLPILAVCGWSGSGKTTLIEQLVPLLRAKGLDIVVVKHDVHGIDVDHPGKDSDRFFRAGADVLLRGKEEAVLRTHRRTHRPGDLEDALKSAARRYDLLLVEGHKDTPLRKLWLYGPGLTPGEESVPSDVSAVMAALPRESDRVAAAMSILDDWLAIQWLKTPVFGCVLGAGRPFRAGPHLLDGNEDMRLTRKIESLRQVTERIVLAGLEAPPCYYHQMDDAVLVPAGPDDEGPLAGLLAAMRWAPWASWLVVADDLRGVSREALDWLLSTRRPGVWAALPRLDGKPVAVPALAHYDFRAHAILESMARGGDSSPAGIASSPKVIAPAIPQQVMESIPRIPTDGVRA